MWPFKKQPHTREMVKVTLTDGQEFIAETGTTVRAMQAWAHIYLDGEKVIYPRHRIQEVRFWREGVD